MNEEQRDKLIIEFKLRRFAAAFAASTNKDRRHKFHFITPSHSLCKTIGAMAVRVALSLRITPTPLPALLSCINVAALGSRYRV